MPKRDSPRASDAPPAQQLVNLARQQGADAIPELRLALQHPDPWMRLHAVQGLCTIDHPSARAGLVAALHDPSFGVGWEAAHALTRAGRAGVVAVLGALLHDTPSNVFLHGVEHVLHHATLTPEDRETIAPVLDALHQPAADLEAPMLAVTALERLDRDGTLTEEQRTTPYIRSRAMRRGLRGHIFPGPQEP